MVVGLTRDACLEVDKASQLKILTTGFGYRTSTELAFNIYHVPFTILLNHFENIPHRGDSLMLGGLGGLAP